MSKHLLTIRIQILVLLLGISSFSNAQLYSPGRNWAGLTQYTKVGAIQDSIFVFFSSTASPKKGTLQAKFSDSSKSNYTWYKFDEAHPTIANPFVLIANTDSILTNVNRGGYQVHIERASLDSTEVYTCWLMIDSVTITELNVNNNCNYLEIIAKTTPSALSINSTSIFRYWDLSKSYHSEINTIGRNYFNNLIWHASNSQIVVPSLAALTLIIEEPAPRYDSKYDISITNPFSRILTSETDLLPAIAPTADFTIYVDKDNNDTWIDGGSAPNGEAPFKMKLESKSYNADSIYWRVLNDENLFSHGADSIVWRDSTLLDDRIDAYPPPTRMVPGTFPVQHIAVKVSSGCRDTMTLYVEVDSSKIKPDAIPNVFSPNGDGTNDFFKIKDSETNISSIKTFHVYIYSRQGRLVYEYSGDAKSWKGWNGEIDGYKRNAPDGIYYYIIEAVGWDKKKYKGGVYKGFLYLLRGR